MTATGAALLAAAIALARTGQPRSARLAAGTGGVALLALGVFWWVVAAVVWSRVCGPWWEGTAEQAARLRSTRQLLARLGPEQTRWTRPSLRTASALHADNVALCARLDRAAFRASSPFAGRRAAPVETMWRSLADGRDRHLQLCREMRAMAGQVLAAAPLSGPAVDDRIIEELEAFAERIRTLDCARRELLTAPPAGAAPDPGPSPRSRTAPPAAAEVVELLRARAPDLLAPAVALFAGSSESLMKAAEAMRRWRMETDGLPAETPDDARRAFLAERHRAISGAEGFVSRVLAAEELVAGAARNLIPVCVPPKEEPGYRRASVEKAEGMIAALKEVRRRSGRPGP